MSDTDVINQYLKNLSDGLAALTNEQRTSIANEIRAHLEVRAAQGRLSEAILSLGSAEVCANAYLEELETGDTVTQKSAYHKRSLLTKIWGRLSTIVGFGVTGYLYFFAGVFALCIIFEIIYPSNSGMWLQTGGFHWGATFGGKYNIDSEVLGFWYVPLNMLLVAVFFMLAEWLGRFSKRRALLAW